ncbi:unnamed protein product [Oikopleura dioica]|uniref:WW domain-containing protein n=1 Tax=Oikopleura dioica TaxID=34765 RepID=E4Y9N1_OIKDI|nr:unnamed protein product [Oikopleura dioica]
MNEDEPSNKKRKVDENDEFSEASEDNREDGEIPDSDEDESPLNISTPYKSSEPTKPPITLPVKCPFPGALRLPVFLPLPQTMSMSTPKPRSCPVVLPFLPHMMKGAAPPIPLPKPPVSEKESEKELEECYSKTYSDENSEASDQEVSDMETETTSFDRPDSQISSIQTVDSVDIPTGVNSEPSTGELQRTVIENPDFQSSKSAEESQSKKTENDKDRDSENEAKEDEMENIEYEYYTKSIVRHKNGTWVDSKDPIPDGWTVINHHSGFPLYLHKESRVATWARPYYIGTSNAKSHKGTVPLSAIPCLAYSKRSKPKETNPVEENDDSTNVTITGETQQIEENKEENFVQAKIIHTENEHLDNQQIKEYVEKRFEYEEFQGKRYKNQEAYNLSIVRRRQEREENRRNHREENKRRRKQARAEENSDERDDQDLPTLVKTCIEFKSREQKGRPSKNHTIYLQGKTTVTILHEYCNRALKAQPIYEDVRDDLISSDRQKYIIKIDGKEYGSGEGANRTIAKNIAALETLKLLIPDFQPDDKFMLTGRAEQDYGYFNHLSITDNRLHQLCGQAGLPAPYQFLKDIIHKIHGPSGAEEKLNISSNTPNNTTFHYTLGNDVVEGRARSKKNAKHIAAQAMLAKLHPEFKTWGDLLQNYSDLRSIDPKLDQRTNQNDKNDDEEQITTLFKEKNKGPNVALLSKLREMMQKVAKENETRFAESDRIAPLFCENRVQLNSNF